ncbi:hypothetical protein BCV70DRAFT_72608 [Testicularia cyperi]|uniref:Uncharacterized protein n=1 Tax=Testicularia cyperi TaxID=1882483 RepID=A0A317XSX7_9BASI|nr:hypothetical protein BCV70DRAFT_72608 [Testicularia cyperi]
MMTMRADDPLSSPDPARTEFARAGRTLRRKRSYASAALTSRPSLLTIGSLVPSLETCVLIHTSASDSSQGQECRLVHALFEPNFFVDGIRGSIHKLDRSTWEAVRADVEDLRIVALASSTTKAPQTDLPTPASSPRTSSTEFERADCVFDLTGSSNDTSESQETGRSVSRFYIQPRPYTSLPAKSCDELLGLEIRGVGDGILLDHRWSILPDQVKKILYDAELLSNSRRPDAATMQDLAESLQASMSIQPNDEQRKQVDQTCQQILQLIVSRV